ncbi:MAG: DUF2029 domain-containing protein [Bacteroidales bacterium]|nr:DUF2029 domain-containing protein [Bacteroidales bacterium]
MKLGSINRKIIVAFLLAFAIITSITTPINGGDFDVYLDAAKKLSNQSNIYTPPFIKGLQYYYSTFFAWVLIPFHNYVILTEILWSLLSFALLYRTFKLVTGYFETEILSKKEYNFWVFLITFFSFQFILYNVAMIQITFFLLWAIFESLNQISKGKFILGGSILGLAINIKLMPILLLPYLFYRGYLKALSVTILTIVLLLFIPAISLGWDFNAFLLSEWWTIINPSNKEHLFETEIGTHSIVAMLPVYLTQTIGEMDYQRNILNLNSHVVEIIINITRIFLLTISLFFFKSLPFRKEENSLKSLWEISYFVLLIPLLLPHQQKYAFILAVPMITYLLYFFILTYKHRKTIGYKIALYTFMVCLLFFSPIYGSDIIGAFLFKYTQHFRFLSFATILLIPISIFCSPKKLRQINQEKASR